MKAYGVIPARLNSTRLPRKLLLDATGKPLIQHTWEAAAGATLLGGLLVATDSVEIAAAVLAFGGRCEMTGEHASGTDRIAEAARRHLTDADVIVNIQGDEPQMDPRHIDLAVRALCSQPSAQMATLAAPIRDRESLESPSCVKVVCAADGRAMYFSRSAIPHCRDGNIDELLRDDSSCLRHIGLYAYRADYLQELSQMPVSKLEGLEKLEQLRALESGADIRVAVIDAHAAGIDTPADYAKFVNSFKAPPRDTRVA